MTMKSSLLYIIWAVLYGYIVIKLASFILDPSNTVIKRSRCIYSLKRFLPTWLILFILLVILIFSISAGSKKDFFLFLGDMGGVLPFEKLEVDVDPLWEEDKLSRLLELSKTRDLGASWVSVKKINRYIHMKSSTGGKDISITTWKNMAWKEAGPFKGIHSWSWW